MSTDTKEIIDDLNVVEETDGSVTVDLPDHLANLSEDGGQMAVRIVTETSTTLTTRQQSERQGATAAGLRRTTSNAPTKRRTSALG